MVVAVGGWGWVGKEFIKKIQFTYVTSHDTSLVSQHFLYSHVEHMPSEYKINMVRKKPF